MMLKFSSTLLLAFYIGCGATIAEQNLNVTGVINSLLDDYDKRVRPGFGGDPVDVGVSIYAISFSSLSDTDMDFTMHFYFRQFWMDPRLSFEKKPGLDHLTFGTDMGHEIWLPDTFFVNEKESFKHPVTVKNEFIRINHDGYVSRSSKYTVTANCGMNFKKFPFDVQTCQLTIESYGHTAAGIKYHWKDGDNSFKFSSTSCNGLFELIDHDLHTETIRLTSASYSSLKLDMEFKRLSGVYLQLVYIPCLMLVIMSWLSFYLHGKAFNIRLALSGLSLLLMVIGCCSLSNIIPKTTYVKALDVYTGVCLTFVFVALLEFAYISNCNADIKDFLEDTKAYRTDKFFRSAFPMAFGAFIAVYWFYYLRTPVHS